MFAQFCSYCVQNNYFWTQFSATLFLAQVRSSPSINVVAQILGGKLSVMVPLSVKTVLHTWSTIKAFKTSDLVETSFVACCFYYPGRCLLEITSWGEGGTGGGGYNLWNKMRRRFVRIIPNIYVTHPTKEKPYLKSRVRKHNNQIRTFPGTSFLPLERVGGRDWHKVKQTPVEIVTIYCVLK